MPEIRAGDMATIGQPLDFLAFNTYFGHRVRLGAEGKLETIPDPPGDARGMLPWLRVTDDALYWVCRYYHERYGPKPLVVTENGVYLPDWVHLDGQVHDPARIDYTRRYLRGLKRAAAEGLPVRGYYHWSLLDNFEWTEGYRPRFGLIHVDFATQKRTPKDSFHWYRDTIRENGAHL